MKSAVVAAALACAFAPSARAEICVASWYGAESGPRTANGERFVPGAISCAHKIRPFGAVVSVTDLATGRHITCRINDRGPFRQGRCIDLSLGAARALGITGRGLARVDVQ